MKDITVFSKYKVTITNLFYLLVYSDGSANGKELLYGQQMIATEGILESDFKSQIDEASTKNASTLLLESISSMKCINRDQQIRVIAWLCVVANADGFMDRAEWQMIYRIYHKELGLPLDEIIKLQKELARNIQLIPSAGI